MHELEQDFTRSKLHSLLTDDMGLTDDAVAKICDCVRDSDLCSACHRGPLTTAYSQTQTFKKKFKYIEPKKLTLGIDESNTQINAYYIPLKQTLHTLLESELWKNHVTQQYTADSREFSDIHDGQILKSNKFFIDNPGCLKLILYQDSFEIANPLGSAKKKHKVLAVYLSATNLPAYVRSNTDHVPCVVVWRERLKTVWVC